MSKTKTPGTHPSDDHSQQPRQTETPTPTERAAISREDHMGARDKLAENHRDKPEQPQGKSEKPRA